ncbi:hypothetical protein BX600DRAFT_434653 [Xylariales sp. PMI_506]|nr:hypothetical protein BX600DRAFT_434653 [Xylariales sp. PMI_506]
MTNRYVWMAVEVWLREVSGSQKHGPGQFIFASRSSARPRASGWDFVDIPNSNGVTVSGIVGTGSASGGCVGLGNIDGSGVGYLLPNGTILCQPPPLIPNESDLPYSSTTITSPAKITTSVEEKTIATPTPTTTETPTPTISPTNWAKIVDKTALLTCGCSSSKPVFTVGSIKTWRQMIINDLYLLWENPILSLEGEIFSGSALWAPDRNADCSITVPVSVTGCYNMFDHGWAAYGEGFE